MISHPYTYIDLERDPAVQDLLDHFGISAADIPVVICRDETPLRNPTNEKLTSCLGFNPALNQSQVRDLVVVGAGPSGLAAAVYGASEGFDVLLLETYSPGAQAGSSSRIENYLGFPAGISGNELAGRAYTQAQKFGAQMALAKATGLTCERKPYIVELQDGSRIPARAIAIATGARYSKLPLDNLALFEGVGVYYGAKFVAQQSNRRKRNKKCFSALHHDWRRSQHSLAGSLRDARRKGLCKDRAQSVIGGTDCRALAADA